VADNFGEVKATSALTVRYGVRDTATKAKSSAGVRRASEYKKGIGFQPIQQLKSTTCTYDDLRGDQACAVTFPRQSAEMRSD